AMQEDTLPALWSTIRNSSAGSFRTEERQPMAVRIRERRCPGIACYDARLINKGAAPILQFLVFGRDTFRRDDQFHSSGQRPVRTPQAGIQHQIDGACREECELLPLTLKLESRLVSIEFRRFVDVGNA